MKANLRLVLALAIMLTGFCGFAQGSYWKTKGRPNKSMASQEVFSQEFYLDVPSFINALKPTGLQSKSEVLIPTLTGNLLTFQLSKTSNFAPELQKKYPQLGVYIGTNTTGTHSVAIAYDAEEVSITQLEIKTGRYAYITKEGNNKNYLLYQKGVHQEDKGFSCTITQEMQQQLSSSSGNFQPQRGLKTFRLAVSTTGEYTQYHGGTVEGALSAINQTMTRINFIFQRDLGVKLELINEIEPVLFLNASNDPYQEDYSSELQTTLREEIGEERYDLGHLFHRDFNNGNAGGIGTVCKDGLKGRAFSSAMVPEGDLYDLDYVAHEMGHQFGANHTWSYESEGTGTQVEPASGTTIMAYAGIVEGNNVAPNGDDYFHVQSIVQIRDYLSTVSCGTESVGANDAPQWTATRNEYTIPAHTPFILEQTATDNSPTQLSYCWEQIDNGVVNASNFGPTNTVGAAFRSLPPSPSNQRYFPSLDQVLEGTLTQTNPGLGSSWETLSQVSRSYTFALTARDNATDFPQIAIDTVVVKAVKVDDRFAFASFLESRTVTGGSVEEVRWNTAKTEQFPFNVATVSILLSTDGGQSFPITLAERVANIGTAKIQFPNVDAELSRLMIRADDNIFYTVNPQNFILESVPFSVVSDALTYTVCDEEEITIPLEFIELEERDQLYLPFEELPDSIEGQFSVEFIDGTTNAFSLVITQLGTLSPGEYDITIGIQGGDRVFELPLLLQKNNRELAIPELLIPEEELIASLRPELKWTSIEQADGYKIELGTTATFDNIIQTQEPVTNSIKALELNSETTYYWRVKAFNKCGFSEFSNTGTFTTAAINCSSFDSRATPITISEEGTPTVLAAIQVFDDLEITDVSIRLELTHSYLEDLIINLISPVGERITLLSKNCGNGQNIDVVFQSDGTVLSCGGNPSISGVIRPIGNLQDLVGSRTKGEWVLEVNDTAAADGGMLNAFEITFCAVGNFLPDTDQDGVPDDGTDLCLDTPLGAIVDGSGCLVEELPKDIFEVNAPMDLCPAEGLPFVLITTTRPDIDFVATLSGEVTQLMDFVNGQALFENLSNGSYSLCINTKDDTFNYSPTCYDLDIQQNEPLKVDATYIGGGSMVNLIISGGEEYTVFQNTIAIPIEDNTVILELEDGLNTVSVLSNGECSEVVELEFFKTEEPILFPNPATNFTQVLFGKPHFVLKAGLFNTQGKLMWSAAPLKELSDLTIPLANLPLGTYILLMETSEGKLNFQVFKDYE